MPLRREDFIKRYRRLEKDVERLKRRFSSGPEWHSLAEYLCGGWTDPYLSTPWRSGWSDTFEPDDAGSENGVAGFFDCGNYLLFTGCIRWDPDGWWGGSVPVTGATGGVTYPLNMDAQGGLVDHNGDGFGNGTADMVDIEVDRGQWLPYRFNNQQFLVGHAHFDTVVWEEASFWSGSRIEFFCGNVIGGGGLFFDAIRTGGGDGCVDPEGWTHLNAPPDSTWHIGGNVLFVEQDPEDGEP